MAVVSVGLVVSFSGLSPSKTWRSSLMACSSSIGALAGCCLMALCSSRAALVILPAAVNCGTLTL